MQKWPSWRERFGRVMQARAGNAGKVDGANPAARSLLFTFLAVFAATFCIFEGGRVTAVSNTPQAMLQLCEITGLPH